MIKTLKGWELDGRDLSTYLQVGDEVDEELMYYFLNVLPPATWTATCIQIGEPYSDNENGPTFSTLEKIDGKWTYQGHKNRPKRVKS